MRQRAMLIGVLAALAAAPGAARASDAVPPTAAPPPAAEPVLPLPPDVEPAPPPPASVLPAPMEPPSAPAPIAPGGARGGSSITVDGLVGPKRICAEDDC